MMKTFPVFLDMTDRLAVVVGGGPVGQRKANALLEAGARVRVVCLVSPRLAGGGAQDTPGKPGANWVVEPYRAEHLDRATLVFAAATPEVNAQVVADAKARGIWVNSASDPDVGDFHMPSSFRRGDLLIAVGTGGAAPAVARQVRDRIAVQFDDAWAGWLEMLRELRCQVLGSVADPAMRRELFERLSDLAWLDRYRADGADAVREAMRQVVEQALRR